MLAFYLYLNPVEWKAQLLGHTSHVSGAQRLHIAGGYRPGQGRIGHVYHCRKFSWVALDRSHKIVFPFKWGTIIITSLWYWTISFYNHCLYTYRINRTPCLSPLFLLFTFPFKINTLGPVSFFLSFYSSLQFSCFHSFFHTENVWKELPKSIKCVNTFASGQPPSRLASFRQLSWPAGEPSETHTNPMWLVLLTVPIKMRRKLRHREVK